MNPHELLGKTPFEIMDEDEAQRVSTIFSEIITKRFNITNLENSIRHKDGHIVHLLTSGSPFYNSKGKLQGY